MEKSKLKENVEEVMSNLMLNVDYAYGSPCAVKENHDEIVNDLVELLYSTYIQGVRDTLKHYKI